MKQEGEEEIAGSIRTITLPSSSLKLSLGHCVRNGITL
jgi:hypothetical protein